MNQLNTAAIVVYNPPPPNFQFTKFKDVVQKIEKYLAKNEERGEKQLDISLMGDFNFPPSIVKWEKGDQGLFPALENGETDRKLACRMLVDMMDRFSLFQLVDKPTRKNNILDLFITDNPHAYSSCKTQNMKPLSDHRMVSFQLTAHQTETGNLETALHTKNIPEIATYNLGRADQQAVKEAINNSGWRERQW